jgi:ankyrin repeat protein
MQEPRKVPREGRQVDVAAMSAKVNWDDPTEMEKVILSDLPPNSQRLIEEVRADPGLALLSWREGDTLLHVAAGLNDLMLAEVLLQNGAIVDAVSPAIGTPLLMAAEYNHRSMLRLLLSHGAIPDAPNGIGRTALHFAALRNNSEAVSELLRHGALVGVRDNAGVTPLDVAAYNCYPRVARLLVDAGGRSRKKRTIDYLATLATEEAP